jgi:hypothetical protein
MKKTKKLKMKTRNYKQKKMSRKAKGLSKVSKSSKVSKVSKASKVTKASKVSEKIRKLLRYKSCFVFLKGSPMIYLLPHRDKDYKEDVQGSPTAYARSTRGPMGNIYSITSTSVGSDVMPYSAFDFDRVITKRDVMSYNPTLVPYNEIPEMIRVSFQYPRPKDGYLIRVTKFEQPIDIYIDKDLLDTILN